MSNRIEGSSPLPQFGEVDTASPAQGSQQVNRVEAAKVDERQFADGNPFSTGKVRDYLDGIPTPGAAELEVHGYFDHNGAQLKANIERSADGQYEVKVKGAAQLGLHLGVGAFAGGNATGTFSFRTPEAAADFLTSIAGTQAPLVGEISRKRLEHYAKESMHQFGMGSSGGVSAFLPMPCVQAGLEAKGEASVTYDANRGSLVIDQAVGGEALGRMGAVIFGGGLEAEVAAHVRTELRAPPDVLEKLRSGALSLQDLVNQSSSNRKLILEADGRGEFTTPFAVGQSKSELIKGEAEIDLDAIGNLKLQAIADDPKRAQNFVHGSVKRYHALEVAGSELQMMVADVKMQAARYSVSETPLFHHEDHGALQRELDGKRLTTSVPH